MTVQFKAYGNAGTVYADTAKQAAIDYFEKFPKSRKCNITQGKLEGEFFVVAYGRASLGQWPKSYKDITKKTMLTIEE